MKGRNVQIIAPSGVPAPVLWGDETVVRERFGHGISDLKMTRRHYDVTYPFPPAEVVEFFRQYYGPTNRAFASLDDTAARKLREELEALWSAHNRAKAEVIMELVWSNSNPNRTIYPPAVWEVILQESDQQGILAHQIQAIADRKLDYTVNEVLNNSQSLLVPCICF